MEVLRSHLVKLLEGGQAYDTFDDVVAEFEPHQVFVIPEGAEHSAWQILEHIRLSLRDIFDFSTNEDGHYAEKNWPADYWPANPAKANPALWNETVNAYRSGLAEFEHLVRDPKRELFDKFRWGEGQTLCREAMLVAQHEAYHLGELVMLRRMFNASPMKSALGEPVSAR